MARPKKKKKEPVVENTEVAVLSPSEMLLNGMVSQDNVDLTLTQIRAIMIGQAKLNLEKVISLTKTLDQIQDLYQERALRYALTHDDDSSLVYLPRMIETITTCLEASYSMINRVVSNEKIMNFSVVQNNISDSTIKIESAKSSYTGTLKSPISRERVRSIALEILRDENLDQGVLEDGDL